jgi:GMP synthase-like glutamine amidotransferase
MRAVVVGNESEPDMGHVGRRLRERGVEISEWRREGHGEWPNDDPEMFVLLGSDWSVYWDHLEAAVLAEQELVRRCHQRQVPVLAVCFGAQVVAAALGGAVEASPTPEIGWYTIDSAHPRIAAGPWMQWHNDRVIAPPDAIELASSPLATQAFRMPRILAVQFHPEVTSGTVQRWASGAGAKQLASAGVDRDQLLADTAAYGALSSSACDDLVDWFCDEVSGS